jgi:hypothetical protein
MSERAPEQRKQSLSDADVRPSLRARLLAQAAAQPDTVIIDELGVCRGQVRIDLAVVNGTLHGYEIKSDRDSLRRLGAQIDYYSRVLERATIVVGERYLPRVQALVPPWWGVLRIKPTAKGPHFKTVRRGRKNPSLDARSLVELLWLEDATRLLETHDAARGVRGKARQSVRDLGQP